MGFYFKHRIGDNLTDQKYCDTVLAKIKYNAPNMYSYHSTKIFEEFNIDSTLPIYLIENPSKKDLNLLKKVQKFEQFNIIVFSEKKIHKSNGIYVFDKKNMPKSLKEHIYCFNINYPVGKIKLDIPNFENLVFDKVNFQTKFENFCLKYYYSDQNSEIEILQNKAFLTCFSIKISTKTKISFNFIKKLDKSVVNYYFFEHSKKMFVAQNLLNSEKYYFKTNINPSTHNFSQIAGIQNSNLPQLNFKFDVLGQKNFNFSFGEIIPTSFDSVDLNKKILSEILCFKISTPNSKINELFNNILPKKIILEGISEKISGNFTLYEILEMIKIKAVTAYQAYELLKEVFISQAGGYIRFKNAFERYSIKFFDKQIFIESGEDKSILIDGVKYANLNVLTLDACKKAKGDIKVIL